MADTVGFHSYEASLRLICNYMRMSAHGLQQKKKRVVLNKTVQCFRGACAVYGGRSGTSESRRTEAQDGGEEHEATASLYRTWMACVHLRGTVGRSWLLRSSKQRAGSDFVDTLARNANISRECSSMVGHKLVLEDYVKPVSEKSPEFRDDGSLFAFNLPVCALSVLPRCGMRDTSCAGRVADREGMRR